MGWMTGYKYTAQGVRVCTQCRRPRRQMSSVAAECKCSRPSDTCRTASSVVRCAADACDTHLRHGPGSPCTSCQINARFLGAWLPHLWCVLAFLRAQLSQSSQHHGGPTITSTYSPDRGARSAPGAKVGAHVGCVRLRAGSGQALTPLAPCPQPARTDARSTR
jgi:hypothetical protein